MLIVPIQYELVPKLVKRLLDDDLDFITCDRCSWLKAALCQAYMALVMGIVITTRLLFGYGIKDSQSGMWVFRKSIFNNEKMKPTNDGMPLSEEIKILARKHLEEKSN